MRLLAAVSTLVLTLAAPAPAQQPDSARPRAAAGAVRDSASFVDTRRQLDLLVGKHVARFEEPLRVVVRDSATWTDLWTTATRHTGGASAVYRPPGVDFTREMVLVIALGPQPSLGTRLRLDSLTRTDDVLTVWSTVTRPGSGCVSQAAIGYPAVVRIVPAVSRGVLVLFAEHLEVGRKCF